MVLPTFEDAVGILMIGKMLPEAADVVFHDAVAGEKPSRQSIEVVETMSIPLELVDEPPDVRRQCTYHKTTPRHQQNLGRHVERVRLRTSTRDAALIMAMRREGHFHLEGRPPALDVLDDFCGRVRSVPADE